MDLMRVVKTALEIDKPFEKAIAYMFLDKALQEFESNLPKETLLKNELQLFIEKNVVGLDEKVK